MLDKILKEIDARIALARGLIVDPPQDSLDQIANDAAEDFISAYEECKEIAQKYLGGSENVENKNSVL